MLRPPAPEAWLEHYGYIALALGVFAESAAIPVPGETLLLAAGALAEQGHLSLVTVILVAAAAGIAGDNAGFFLGRRLGRGWLARHGHRILLTPARLAQMDAFFKRFGPEAVILARFVTGVRVVAAFVAGTSQMHWRAFLIFNMIGAAAWATVVALLGFALGRGYSALAGAAGHVGIVAFALAVTLGVGAWVLHRRVREQPRAAIGEQRAEVPSAALPSLLRRAGPRVAFALGAGVCAAWAFLALVEEVAEGETATFDLMVRSWTLAHRSPLLDILARAAAWSGSMFVLGAVVVLVAWWLWRRGGRTAAALVLLAPVASSLILLLSVRVLHRAGPGGVPGTMPGYSFPGGESTASAAVVATLAYILLRERLAPWIIVIAAALYVLLEGWSRIYLGRLWTTDVVAGWTLGLGIAMLSAVVYEEAVASTTPPAALPPPRTAPSPRTGG